MFNKIIDLLFSGTFSLHSDYIQSTTTVYKLYFKDGYKMRFFELHQQYFSFT